MTHARSILKVLTAASLFAALALPAAAQDKVIKPFNGKNLHGWKFQGPESHSKWHVGIAKVDPKDPTRLVLAHETPGRSRPAEMVNAIPRGQHGVDIYTAQKFGSAAISLELMVPKGSNSGVYMMGEYEVQVLDSYGHEHPNNGDMGAIYGIKAPDVNASKKPGQWQTLSIEFIAPKFENGKKVADLRVVKVVQNGKVIQENVDVPHPTGGGVTNQEHAEGPLMFQGNHGPVAYRNIKIILKK